MKVIIQKIETTDIEVELPEKCPGCGQDFTATPLSLLEEQYSASNQPCRLATGEAQMAEYGSHEYCEGDFVTGYRCCSCGESVVTTEGDGPIELATGADVGGGL